MFEVAELHCRRGARPVLADVSFHARSGEFIALCGLNGAGKSTLLELMAGHLPDYQGACRLEGREIRQWIPLDLARQVSYLPQGVSVTTRFTVAEVVRMGRHPFAAAFRPDPDAEAACRTAMEQTGCDELAPRFADQLSGGQRQRVLLAAVLAQRPRALLLDEPGSFIDLPHQIAMFSTLAGLGRQGLLCMAATHDLNLAAAFCTRLILLHQGELRADGPPEEVLGGAVFQQVFGGEIQVTRLANGQARVHYAT